MDLELRDRVYVLTGGTRGLGRATAEALVSEGARIVLSGRGQQDVDAAIEDLGTDSAVGVAADNADPATAERLVATALSRWGRLDGALVSVGGPPPGSALESTEEDWRASFESIFLGTLRLVRATAAACHDGGSIALVLSSSVRSPIPGLAISNGLRPGLAGLAKNLADELGPQGIRVNGLLPGSIDTERLRSIEQASGQPEAARRRTEQNIPLRRTGKPEEFGRLAAVVLSPAASYLTGAMIPIDGGSIRAI